MKMMMMMIWPCIPSRKQIPRWAKGRSTISWSPGCQTTADYRHHYDDDDGEDSGDDDGDDDGCNYANDDQDIDRKEHDSILRGPQGI